MVLDGCDHRGALKAFEHVEATPEVYLNLTEHGFVKQRGALADEAELVRAHALIPERLRESACSTAS